MPSRLGVRNSLLALSTNASRPPVTDADVGLPVWKKLEVALRAVTEHPIP